MFPREENNDDDDTEKYKQINGHWSVCFFSVT